MIKLTNPNAIGKIKDVSGNVRLGIQANPPIVSSVKVIAASKSCFGIINVKFLKLIDRKTHIGNCIHKSILALNG